MERDDDPAIERSVGGSRNGPFASAVDLGQRVRTHEDPAFRRLVERYQSEIFAFTRAVTGDEDEAANLAQKIFVRAYRNSCPPGTAMSITTLLYRLMFEECVLQGRINSLRTTLQAFQTVFVPGSATRTETARPGQTCKESAVRKGLQALSAEARVLLLLREVAHQSVSDLAQITGRDVNAIRKQLLKARRDLSIALQQVGWRGSVNA